MRRVWGSILVVAALVAFAAAGCSSSPSAPADASSSPPPPPSLTGAALEQAIRAAVTPPARIYEFAYSPEGGSAIYSPKGSSISLMSVGTCLEGVPAADLQQAADQAAFQVVRTWYTLSPKWDYCRVLVFDRSVQLDNLRLQAGVSRKDAAALDWGTATAADLHARFTEYLFSRTSNPVPMPSGL